MKVLIINPPAYNNRDYIREDRCMQTKSSWLALWMPLSLAYIAAVLREERHVVRLIDCIAEKMNEEDLINVVNDFSPQLVVLNTAFPSIKGDIKISEIIKKTCSNTKITIIGLYPTLLEEKCFQEFRNIDFCVVGEPEWVVKNLVNALDTDKPLNKIYGLIINNIIYFSNCNSLDTEKSLTNRNFTSNDTKNESGKIVNKAQDYTQNNINELPFLARDLLKNEAYRLPTNRKKFTLITIARGCSSNCSFCTANV